MTSYLARNRRRDASTLKMPRVDGDALEAMRARAKMTTPELAAMLLVNEATIWRWEDHTFSSHRGACVLVLVWLLSLSERELLRVVRGFRERRPKLGPWASVWVWSQVETVKLETFAAAAARGD
jgi:hypothetical protein